MIRVSLTVNGEAVEAEVEPRTHLADFLREARLLTGTHLGCEHGVCGACTIEIDGAPARSCITLAVACDGAEVRTIEGFDEDPLMGQLRAAFTREHALQCGYCTPGMMISARDLIRRAPGADQALIRREMEGNLCRCTGYVGIVRAVQSVMEAPAIAGTIELSPVVDAGQAAVTEQTSTKVKLPAGAMRLSQQFSIGQQITDVWAVFRDIEALAACMPGAELTAPPRDGHVTGRISAGLGPIRAAFTGEADVAFDDAQRNGTVSGSGRDGATGSSALGEVTFALHEEGSGATRIDVEVAYALSGTFAQFSRGDLVTGVAQAMTDAFATNLEARLLGGDLVSVSAQVGLGTVIGAAIRGWLRKLLGIN